MFWKHPSDLKNPIAGRINLHRLLIVTEKAPKMEFCDLVENKTISGKNTKNLEKCKKCCAVAQVFGAQLQLMD